MTVVADDRAMQMNTRSALARPRGFHLPADRLRRLDGPVHVLGADGRELTGSPIDPSTERRSAERTEKIVAGLFLSPGRRQTAASLDLAFLSAPAHVIGGPVEGGSGRRRVDVVIPVYGGLDCIVDCLQSVLADLPRWSRVVVVDDASPDPCVADALAGLTARRRITLLTAGAAGVVAVAVAGDLVLHADLGLAGRAERAGLQPRHTFRSDPPHRPRLARASRDVATGAERPDADGITGGRQAVRAFFGTWQSLVVLRKDHVPFGGSPVGCWKPAVRIGRATSSQAAASFGCGSHSFCFQRADRSTSTDF
jgi:hypothetical protein